MAAVLGQYSSTSNNNRRVGFADSINWEEENRRSCRGSESRRRKREKRKMERTQQNEKMQGCLEILAKSDNEEEIVQVCRRSLPARGCILGFFIDPAVDIAEERQPGEDWELQLRRLLRTFQETDDSTLESINDYQKDAIGTLVGNGEFLRRFKDFMPASAVSSEESTPEREGQPAREQIRRNSVQHQENMAKEVARIVGRPDAVLGNPPDVVREGEDN